MGAFLVLLMLLGTPGPGLAALAGPRGDAAAVVKALEARYSHARTLEAAFYERYTTGGQGGQAESGTVYFSKPGRMRWDYESPGKKMFLVDGKNVWLYVPADHTASKASLKESADWRTPLALLTGNSHLERLCGRIEFAGARARGGAPVQPRAVMLVEMRCRLRRRRRCERRWMRGIVCWSVGRGSRVMGRKRRFGGYFWK